MLFPLGAIAEQVEERSDLGQEGCRGISLLGIWGRGESGTHCYVTCFSGWYTSWFLVSLLDLWHVDFEFSRLEMG